MSDETADPEMSQSFNRAEVEAMLVEAWTNGVQWGAGGIAVSPGRAEVVAARILAAKAPALTGVPPTPDEVLAAVDEAIGFHASAAKCLRGEVERGVTLRQSAEAKIARAEVNEVAADRLRRIAESMRAAKPRGIVDASPPQGAVERAQEAVRARCVALVDWHADNDADLSALADAMRSMPLPAPEGALPVLRTCGDCGWWEPSVCNHVDRGRDFPYGRPTGPKDAPPPSWCPLRGGR